MEGWPLCQLIKDSSAVSPTPTDPTDHGCSHDKYRLQPFGPPPPPSLKSLHVFPLVSPDMGLMRRVWKVCVDRNRDWTTLVFSTTCIVCTTIHLLDTRGPCWARRSSSGGSHLLHDTVHRSVEVDVLVVVSHPRAEPRRMFQIAVIQPSWSCLPCPHDILACIPSFSDIFFLPVCVM